MLYRRFRVAVINSTLPDPYHSYGDHWRDGFLDLGCDVEVIPYDKIDQIPPKFDLYFFVEIRYNAKTIPWYLYPRVLYSWDSHIIGPEIYESIANCFDRIFLASKVDVQTLKKRSPGEAFRFEWLPEAGNPRVHRDIVNVFDRPYDLGFVGNYNRTLKRKNVSRDEFNDFLTINYKFLRACTIYGDKYNEAQNRIKIMFDRPITHNLGTRIFESACAGCVPLYPKTGIDNGLDVLFKENVHYASYDDTLEGMHRVLQELLKDPMSIKMIADSAKKHVMENHTYAHRAMQVIKNLGINDVAMLGRA